MPEYYQPTAAELRQWQTVIKPQMAIAAQSVPTSVLQRAGGEVAGAELAARGEGYAPIGAGALPLGFNGVMEPGQEDLSLAQEAFRAAEALPEYAVATGAGVEAIAGGDGVQMGFPLVAGAGALIAKFMSLGAVKALLARYGPTIVKALLGGAVFAWVMKLITGGASDETIIDTTKKRRKRYTIGSNPRVRTLAKVSRHCSRLLKRHEKVIREFLPKKKATYGIPPSRALSAIERAAIKG